MMDAGRHPLIEVFTLSEVVALDGSPGNYTATIRTAARFVDVDLCTGCGDCSDVCPVAVPNEFDLGLGTRKAIYSPFPQAVPNAYTLDSEHCLNDVILACERCRKACQREAIRYDDQPTEVKVAVGSVIVATGTDVYVPYRKGDYGYGVYPNVLTGLEYERMLNASGPTRGGIIRPSDGATPKKVAFIQCVGARCQFDGSEYCSRFCCLNSAKCALLTKEHAPDVEEVSIHYIDMRAFGKGYDEFHRRTQAEPWIKYVRGKPSKIIEDPDTKDLILYTEDQTTGKREERRVSMVILASAGMPKREMTEALAKNLGIETDEYGFFVARQASTQALEATRESIYLCGCARGPEDIPDSVAQASGAAALAGKHLADFRVPEVREEIPQVDTSGPPRIGVFLCHCGANIAGVLDVSAMAKAARTMPNVVMVQEDLFACADQAQRTIQEKIAEHNLNRVVAAACTPRTHEPIFRETLRQVGLNPFLFEMVNVRDQCSWVHSHEPKAALERAIDQIRMAIARAARLEPLESQELKVTPSAVVIGGGLTGMRAATDLANQGFPVTLIEASEKLGGRANKLNRVSPENIESATLVKEALQRLKASGAKVLTETEIVGLDGFVGDFTVRTTNGDIKAGAVILAVGSDTYNPVGEYGFGMMRGVVTNLQFEEILGQSDDGLELDGKPVKTVAFVQCVGSRDPNTNPGCSRFCCATTVKQALALRKRGINAIVYYRDMRTFSHHAEELYREARKAGVIFVRYNDGDKPEVLGDDYVTGIKAYTEAIGEEVEADVDMVVLAAGLNPHKEVYAKLKEMMKVPTGPDGFFMERHPKLGPVETNTEGIFVCGCAQGPKDLTDSISQASGAAGKAATLLSHETVLLDPTTCAVDVELCRDCGTCVAICEYHAPNRTMVAPGVFAVQINEALCKGCGTCAAMCPSGAIRARHFTDSQIESMMKAFLLGAEV
jgi:heterodisulfide reductase subunit A